MDVVVADIPVKEGMLLSRSWVAKLKGTLQMDMSYATIPIFVEQRILYRGNRLAYMISSPECPQNHPIYSIDTNLGSVIFCNDSSNKQFKNIMMIKKNDTEEQGELIEVMPVHEKWWNLHFDGKVGKDGAGAGICINGPNHDNFLCSYKLYLDCTNNVSEYEALILGIERLIELKIKNMFIYEDLELIINQVKGVYQEKHPRMRSYRNLVLDLLKIFEGYQLTAIPRGHNVIANALAVAASLFKILIHSNMKI